MADDGAAWQNGLEAGFARPTNDAALLARERFQDVLSEFAERLASPNPMRRETAVGLVQQLDRLGRRMAKEHELSAGRAAELDAALAAITQRLTDAGAREAQLAARVDSLLAELSQARAVKRQLLDARGVRTIVAAAAACAALIAGVVAVSRQPSVTAEPATAVVPIEVTPVESATSEPPVAPDPTPATMLATPPTALVKSETRPARHAHSREAPPRVRVAEPEVTAEPAPQPASAPNPVLSSASLKDTQTFLAQQGYYIGPIDGLVSVTLKDAAEAYLRDHKVANLP